MRLSLLLGLMAGTQLVGQFVFQLLVLRGLGVGQESDAFVAAQAVPLVLSGVLGVALQAVWQSRLATAGSTGGGWQTSQRVAHAQALITSAMACGTLLASAQLWVPLLFSGLTAQARNVVLEITPSLMLAALLQSAAAVLVAAQRGRDRQVSSEWPSLAGTTLAALAVAPAIEAWGVAAAAHVLLARAFAVWIVLLALVGGSSPDWRGAWRDAVAWRGLWPLLASSSVYKASPLVDRFWSAMAPAGGVTLLSLAHGGMSALALVLDRSFCAPISTQLARLVAANDAQGARRLYRSALLHTGIGTGAVALLLLLARPLWAEALLLALKLEPGAAVSLWMMCLLLLGLLYVGAAGSAVVAIYYALGDTRTPAMIGLIGFMIGVIVKSIGFLCWGLDGLVLATSIYYLGNMVVLVVGAERRLLALERTLN